MSPHTVIGMKGIVIYPGRSETGSAASTDGKRSTEDWRAAAEVETRGHQISGPVLPGERLSQAGISEDVVERIIRKLRTQP